MCFFLVLSSFFFSDVGQLDLIFFLMVTLSLMFLTVTQHNSEDDCRDCAVGFANPYAAKTECMECGTAKEPGVGKCQGCVPGTILLDSGDCENCTIGYYTHKMNTKVCKPCQMGLYNDLVGSRGEDSPYCKQCPRGKVGKDEGAVDPSTCLHCVAGRYNDRAGVALRSEAGLTTLQLLSTDCKACPKGRYSSVEAATKESVCISCNVGRYGTDNAATSPSACKLCSEGKYSMLVGATSVNTCTLCPKGFHQSSGGNAFCLGWYVFFFLHGSQV